MNKKLLATLFGFATLTLLLVSTGSINAQESGGTVAKIAIVDFQGILRDSVAAKDIRVQANALRDKLQAEFKEIEAGLRADEEELKSQRVLLSPEAFEDKRLAFEKKVGQFQREVQDSRQEVEDALKAALNTLQESLMPIFDQMVKAGDVNLILDKSQVMVRANDLDITAKVIVELDKILKSVKVEIKTKE